MHRNKFIATLLALSVTCTCKEEREQPVAEPVSSAPGDASAGVVESDTIPALQASAPPSPPPSVPRAGLSTAPPSAAPVKSNGDPVPPRPPPTRPRRPQEGDQIDGKWYGE